MAHIARYEEYQVRAREDVPEAEMRAKLEAHIAANEPTPPDHIEFKLAALDPIRRVTPKRGLVREVVGSMRCLTARCWWYED